MSLFSIACYLLVDFAAASYKEVRAPPSVLFDDDPCADGSSSIGSFQCGTALLQSSNGRRAPRQVPGKKAALQQTEAAALWAAVSELAELAAYNASLMGELRLMTGHAAKQMEAKAPHLQRQRDQRLKLLQEHLESFALCDNDLRSRQEAAQRLNATYVEWSLVHKAGATGLAFVFKKWFQECERQERELKADLSKCLSPARGPQQKCEEEERRLHRKLAECSSLAQVMQSTRCSRASQVAGICDMYKVCRSGMSMAYAKAQKAAQAHHDAQKADWLGLQAVQCLQGVLSEGVNSSQLALELENCRKAPGPPSQDPPPALECVEMEDSPCVEETGMGHPRPDGVDADLAKEAAGGVSLMQEGIEMDVVLPHTMQQAFFGPLATPVCLMVTEFTVLMLIVRCLLTLREKREVDAPKSVDAWCVNSQEGADSPANGWLCAELMVPRRSRCAISVPRMCQQSGWSALVTDKMGQTLFRASTAQVDDELQLSLSRLDGSVLALCHMQQEKETGRHCCHIFQGGISLFASMAWEDAQASWFSRASAEEGAFVVRSETSQTLMRVSASNGTPLVLRDGLGRPVAEVQRSEHPATLRIEVNSESSTDLGLVTAAALFVDSLQSASL
ncbi:unnamed protein product [Effrenium voratum]|uniref:Uncharacterized protein n=1 Tax=Effrenium voratum TaxID=2562239 RepID=A0AA36JEG9_9DINO|nr:unnamed protein product [Effrenium voratum]